MHVAPIEDPDDFAARLKLFLLDCRGGIDAPDRRELDPPQTWQMKVSGGALLKFLRYLTKLEKSESGTLQSPSGGRKRLVGIFDTPGCVAAHDIFRMFRPSAIWVSQREWEQWQREAASRDHRLQFHICYFSHWQPCEKPISEPHTKWLHQESIQLTLSQPRSASHLWEWTGERLRQL